jgi:hypothetical protein
MILISLEKEFSKRRSSFCLRRRRRKRERERGRKMKSGIK